MQKEPADMRAASVMPNFRARSIENVVGTERFQENNSVLDNFAEFFKSNTGEEFISDYNDAMKKFLTELEIESRN